MVDRKRRAALAALSTAWLVGCGGRRNSAQVASDDSAGLPSTSPAPATAPAAPAPAPSVSSARVQISSAATGWLNASNTLHSKWVNPGGDWLDANGTFNGPAATIRQSMPAAGAQTFDISRIDGDLLLTGITGYWDKPTIDGVAAPAFWVDASSAGSLPMPGRYGAPGMILNPGRGRTLSITTASNSQSVRIDRVAGPMVENLAMQATRAVPTIASLEMESESQILAAMGQGNFAVPLAFDPTFAAYNGMKYLRFAITPASQRGISWFWLFPGRSEVYGRYCLFIEDDVSAGITELGVKLPGIAAKGISGELKNPTVSWRMEHGAKDPSNPDLYAAVDYRYAADTGAGFGDIQSFNSIFRAGRWYVIEQYAKANTFDGSIANSDGIGKVWINGNLISNRTGLKWFGNGEQGVAVFDHFHINVYHGGMGLPSQDIHYRIAKIALSSAYMGPPDELAAYNPGLADWVPPAGAISTVSLNVLADDPAVNPELDPATNPNYPGSGPWHEVGGIGAAHVYSGALFAPLLGAKGSMLMTMAGHSQYNDNSVYRYDVETRKFMPLTRPYGSRQVPFRNGVTSFNDIRDSTGVLPWYSSAKTAEYYAGTSKTTTLSDQPAGFQSYDSLVYLPPGYAGAGAKGAILSTGRFARAPGGGGGGNQMHLLDIAKAEANPAIGWSRFGSETLGTGVGTACLAMARRKVYVVTGPSGSTLTLREVDLVNAAMSEYPVVTAPGFIAVAIGSNLRYSELRDCLFCASFSISHDGGTTFGFGIQVIEVSGGLCRVYLPPLTGPMPLESGGGEWVEEHQAYYYYPGSGNIISKITLPQGDLNTSAWDIVPVALTGTAIPQVITQHCSRLRWSPAAQCFLWWPGNASPAQAFRLP